jgi:hypothetical protein
MFAYAWNLNKATSLGACLQAAQKAMQRRNYKIYDSAADPDYLVLGGDDKVSCMVVCCPMAKGTHVVIGAFSSDRHAAELARDDIRDYIQAA